VRLRDQPQSDRDAQFAYLVRQARRFLRAGQPVIAVETQRRIDGRTAQLVAESVLRWWQDLGRRRFRRAKQVLIVADFTTQRAGAWKLALQRVADGTGLSLTICKLPLGTSRWTRIDKQLVCRWAGGSRGRSGGGDCVEVGLVGATIRTGSNGRGPAPEIAVARGHVNGQVTRAAVAGVKLERHEIQGGWNFTIGPR
jgi:hypothetical protein